MFNNLGWPEILMLLLLGLFIFGPDKLPKAISDGVNMLRQLRQMATNATSDLSRELGTDIQLEDLHPRTFIRKHVLSEADEQAIRRPLEQLYRGVRDDVQGLRSEVTQVRDAVDPHRSTLPGGSQSTTAIDAAAARAAAAGAANRYDTDAT